MTRSNKLGRWLRRHSLTLVAALGGATGVAYAAAWHHTTPAAKPAASPFALAIAPPAKTERARDTVQDVVQIALVLDTSGSMDGLINQARSHLWNMVDQIGKMTRVVNGKTRGVRIELALFEYGNDALPASSGYIRQVLPFSTDLDTVSEKLHALFTNGGSEFAGQAIETAVTSLQWSKHPDALRFIFVAGNETFEQGPVSAARAMAAAAKHNITVQLIYCGQKEPSWQAAAALAKSDLMSIDQNVVAVEIPAPQDAEILRLGTQLNATYMAYGADGAAASARQVAADVASANMSAQVALERAQLKSKGSYDNSNWDLVDAMHGNARFFDETAEDKLPLELRGKTLEEKKQIVAKKAAERAELHRQIAKLESARIAFIEAERAKRNLRDETSLQSELMKTTKRIATQKGYKL